MRRTILGLVLLASTAAAAPPAPFVETELGPASAGVQLAVTVDGTGTVATFRVKNVSARSVTFAEEFSCSGKSPWALSTGASERALDHHYHFEPKLHGLTTKLETTCTRNVPTKQRTVASGATVTIAVPFANPGEITTSTDKAFQASAVLVLDRRTDQVVLRSTVATR